MSEFEYFDTDTYSTYNDGWKTHMPTFYDEIDTSLPDDVEAVCGGVPECVFDYAVTNDASFAAVTYAVAVDNGEIQSILSEICVFGKHLGREFIHMLGGNLLIVLTVHVTVSL